MDATTLVTRCARRFHDETFAVISQADWLNYINDCYRNVNGANPLWPWLKQETQSFVITSGSRSTALPSNCLKVTSVYNNTDQYPMRAIEGDTQHIRLYPDQTLTGTPSRYRIFNNKLEVWPLPDADRTFFVDYIVAPSDLGGTTALTYFDATGGAAGNITVTGIAAGDVLLGVIGIDDTTHALTDYTSQFTVTGANTISNIGGSATTGKHLVVSYYSIATLLANTPVWPAQWHGILIDGALELASIDDEQAAQAAQYATKYNGQVMRMIADVTAGQQDRNPEIVDNWY